MNLTRSRRHWWLFSILILAGQIAFIFWLSEDRTPGVRRSSPAPLLHLVQSPASELFALNDPTLFALPHAQGFSGRAWLSSPRVPARSFEWAAELEWLPLPVSHLGQGLAKFVQANSRESISTVAVPQPQLIEPEPSSDVRFAQRSSVRIEGPLRQRKLLARLEPSSWPNPNGDLLTNTAVELLVGEDGRPFSCKRLPPGSGSLEADQEALALARSARFESFLSSGPGRTIISTSNLMTGRLVFTWHTLPKTNSVP